MKRFEDLTFCDDFMFCKVMAKPELCRGILELILDQKIKEAKLVVNIQGIMKNAYFAKGIRLDVLVDDEEHSRYNIEMQVRRIHALPKRARYYSGQMDLDMLQQGMEYEELPDTIVIFLCMFDPFGRGRCLYTFQRQCREEPDLYLEDGTKMVFVNAKGETNQVNPLLREFIEYLNHPEQIDKTSGTLVRQLEQEVEKVRRDYQSKEAYMKLELMMREREKEGERIGFARGERSGYEKGRQSGERLERLKIARNLLGVLEPEIIAKRLGLKLEEVLRLQQ